MPFIRISDGLWLLACCRLVLCDTQTGVLAALLAPKCCPVPRASLRPLLPRTAFLRTLLSLVVTSFTTVCFLTLDTLSCVDGKGTRVVFSLPASTIVVAAQSCEAGF